LAASQKADEVGNAALGVVALLASRQRGAITNELLEKILDMADAAEKKLEDFVNKNGAASWGYRNWLPGMDSNPV